MKNLYKILENKFLVKKNITKDNNEAISEITLENFFNIVKYNSASWSYYVYNNLSENIIENYYIFNDKFNNEINSPKSDKRKLNIALNIIEKGKNLNNKANYKLAYITKQHANDKYIKEMLIRSLEKTKGKFFYVNY